MFLINLQERIDFFRGWIDCGHPRNFWLPGFFDQKSFVTTLLQQKSRKDKLPFDKLELMLTPLEKDADIPDPPKPKELEDPEQARFRDMNIEDSASDFSIGSDESESKKVKHPTSCLKSKKRRS
jgi:hypothetical protein